MFGLYKNDILAAVDVRFKAVSQTVDINGWLYEISYHMPYVLAFMKIICLRKTYSMRRFISPFSRMHSTFQCKALVEKYKA